MMLHDERQFQELIELIYNQVGLDCKQYKVNYLKRRLAVRMRATKKKTYYEYKRLLESDPQEYEWLLDRLTINVSNFFRDPTMYDQMKKIVLPAWQKKSGIKIWSAGCANGEEPYSLSILFQEGLPSFCRWHLLATDIDPAVLEHAREGKYKSETLRTVPASLKGRYFEFDGERWAVKNILKSHITFQIHDLTGSLPDGSFDLIICRNVLIYFVTELQERLFREFYQRLNPGGYLILGKTETLLGDVRKLYHIIDIRERIYQKKEAEQITGTVI